MLKKHIAVITTDKKISRIFKPTGKIWQPKRQSSERIPVCQSNFKNIMIFNWKGFFRAKFPDIKFNN